MKRTLVTVTEFARLQDVSRDTIYKWMQADKLPDGAKVKKVAGRNFISIPLTDGVFKNTEYFNTKP